MDAPPRDASLDLSREEAVQREFLHHFAAPFALLSRSGDVLYLSEKMAGFARPSKGPSSTMLDAYLASELRLPVRTALTDAAKTGKAQRVDNVVVHSDPQQRIFDIEVAPCGADFILVLTEARAVDAVDLGEAVEYRETADRTILETQNLQLRKQLHTIQQEYETSGQELKSTNEELMSTNEELQSSNEELETSREELQSINEELETVNSELQENNRLLIRANSDLKNLFESTDLAVLFLDCDFCVRSFTPSTATLFGLRQRDGGRPISELSSRIDYPELKDDAHKVDQSLQMVEREVVVKASGETFLLRMKPYRTTDNRLDGYVLSFVDITQRKSYENTLKQNEQKLARQYAELENLYDTTPVGLSLMDRDMRWIRINESLAAINGFSVQDHIGKRFEELLPDLENKLESTYMGIFKTGDPVLNLEIAGETPAFPGNTRHWIADFYPVWQDNEVFAVGACVREVTDATKMVQRIQAQNEQQKLLLGELQHRVKNTLATVSSISRFLLEGVDDPAIYQERIEERLGSISRTHDLLTEANWTTATFSEVVKNEAAPYHTENQQRVRLTGPELHLCAKQVLALGMAVHELMTNAAKYGALSVETGHVEITTAHNDQSPENRVSIIWQEVNGPRIETPPKRSGFGSLVLERVLKKDLSGEIDIQYRQDGLRFKVDFMLDAGGG